MVSNKLLMGNRDLRQIYDKQWTVTVVDEVHQLSCLEAMFFLAPTGAFYNAPARKFLLFHSVHATVSQQSLLEYQCN